MNFINYDRKKAYTYAKEMAFKRNSDYYNFDSIGGDCTNFASQVIYAGCRVMNYSSYGWYYNSLNDRAPAWTGVEFLYNFLTSNKESGPYGIETDISNIEVGDIIQLSFNGENFAHSPVVVHTGTIPSINNILVAAHTTDAFNRPLYTYSFQKIRFIHILGART